MVIVTGGAGFIGSNISRRLAETGVRVVVCDRLGRSDKWRNLLGLPLHDVIRPEALQQYLATNADKIPALVHMGAISATTEQDADRILQDNIRATLDIWEWTRANESRLVYASSAATYGDGGQGFSDAMDLAHLSALRPLNAYGWSKAFVDLRAARQTEQGRPLGRWAGLKFFNVYGPGEDHKGEMRSVINKIMPKIINGETIELFRSHKEGYEDGGQKRDFVYVEDCVAMVEWLLANPAIDGLFNVGSGTARTFRDLASATFRSLGQEPRIRYVDMPEILRGKYQYFTEADMSRAREAGFMGGGTSLEDGIDDYVQRWTASR
ncbi:MAG TPA: ADP-glyceromanno-heptose 6-epimerase [Bosea sp. (in: a-proteobacteria)]|uniref:ADP-glyceromanno-heptose 6-epimerase n=1 Tax=Bosea sp. (in: a-proteobacteria) TaxID=1871050 RepID=UPI002E10C739|nr:ADP-glyceromanno-heptose 6-epimerase [Bosea sp. (in: a-proteobacteria)]